MKRFRSWARGEPDREWRGLGLLHSYAADLAPIPLERRTDGDRPVVVMSRLPGVSLGPGALSATQVEAVAAALTTLHTVVPGDEIERLSPRLWSSADAAAWLREQLRAEPPRGSPDVSAAIAAGARWIATSEAARFARTDPSPVFAHADGNPANVLWDGERCRLVDFEDSGASDRAFEIADLIEHVASGLTGVVDADALLAALDLDAVLRRRVRLARRMHALYWLVMLLPGNPGHRRNPAGSDGRQARHVLELLES